MTYAGHVGTIVWKDLLLEARTRERMASMAAFAVLAGVLFNFAVDRATVRPQDIASGLIWMTAVFAGLLGLGRTFDLEHRDAAFRGVLMSPVPLDAVFLGKAISNFVLVYAVSVLVVGVFTLFMGLDLGPRPGAVLATLALGVLGFVAVSTLFSAVSAGTHMGASLLPVLVFPLLLPVVVFGASATSRLMVGRPFGEVSGNVRMLGAFALLALGAGSVLFRYVVEE